MPLSPRPAIWGSPSAAVSCDHRWMTDPQAPLSFDLVGYASIEVAFGGDGVALFANADGLRSLARLFDAMADRPGPEDHIHLTPGMQLTPTSDPLVVVRKERGRMPDGSTAP